MNILLRYEMEDVTCNMCNCIMRYNELDGIYVCTTPECTRYNDDVDYNV